MADLSTVTSNFFPTPKEGFITTLASTITAGAATVPLTSVSGLTNGNIFVGLVEPGEANEQAFTGVVDTAGTQITSVKWTKGTNVGHNAGVTVVDYVTSTAVGMISKGILQEHDQDGTHSDINATSITATTGTFTNLNISGTATAEGWSPTGVAVSSVTNNGNRSYDLTMASTMASVLSPGMRLRTTRTVAAPTQCTDLEASSSQYFSKASPAGCTFTDDFTCMAWIKLESYVQSGIISRKNGTTEGWNFIVNTDGTLQIGSYRIAANNRTVASYQSIPLGRWVHVAATMNNSTNTHTMYIDGVLVPTATTTTGTITALVQGAVDLTVGASQSSGSNPMDGKIAQVAVFSSVLDASTIRSYMSQTLSGAESTLVCAYSFDNSLLDLSANDNDLTANGGALATNADSPFGGTADGTISSTLDYGIVTKVATTTVTCQVPEGCTIPTSGGVTTLEYSIMKEPFGFVGNADKWLVQTTCSVDSTQSSPTSSTWYNLGSLKLNVPVGSWDLSYTVAILGSKAATTAVNVFATLSTSSSTESDGNFFAMIENRGASGTLRAQGTLSRRRLVATTTATDYYLLGQANSTASDLNSFGATYSPTVINAECAYL